MLIRTPSSTFSFLVQSPSSSRKNKVSAKILTCQMLSTILPLLLIGKEKNVHILRCQIKQSESTSILAYSERWNGLYEDFFLFHYRKCSCWRFEYWVDMSKCDILKVLISNSIFSLGNIHSAQSLATWGSSCFCSQSSTFGPKSIENRLWHRMRI